MVATDSLKLIFPCDVFVGVSDRIECHCFLSGRRRRLKSLLINIYKTAGYCLDDCFASCENIIWISFERMYGKLLSPPPLPPNPEREVAADSRANNSAATHDIITPKNKSTWDPYLVFGSMASFEGKKKLF